MKKLLSFAVIALAATAIHAAVVSWGGDTLNSANTTGLVGDGTRSDDYIGFATAGTIYNLIYFGSTAPTTPTKYDLNTGLTDVEGGTIVDTHTLDSDEADNGAFLEIYDVAAASGTGNYMVTVYDATTGTADFYSFNISGLDDTGSAFDAKSIMSGEIGNNMGSVAVIPEPTSVALLALGLAALGLKRKIA